MNPNSILSFVANTITIISAIGLATWDATSSLSGLVVRISALVNLDSLGSVLLANFVICAVFAYSFAWIINYTLELGGGVSFILLHPIIGGLSGWQTAMVAKLLFATAVGVSFQSWFLLVCSGAIFLEIVLIRLKCDRLVALTSVIVVLTFALAVFLFAYDDSRSTDFGGNPVSGNIVLATMSMFALDDNGLLGSENDDALAIAIHTVLPAMVGYGVGGMLKQID